MQGFNRTRRWARRFGTGRPLVVGATIFGIRAGILAAVSAPILMVMVAPIEGLAFGLFFVGGVTFIAERAPAGLTGTAQGLFTAVSGLASIVGAAAGGLIAGAISIQGLFAVCAAASVIAALVVGIAVARAVAPGQNLGIVGRPTADASELLS